MKGLGVVGDVLLTVASAAGALVLTSLGVFLERAGLQDLLAGTVALAAWELWMGTAVLFVGLYLLGYRTAWRTFVSLR